MKEFFIINCDDMGVGYSPPDETSIYSTYELALKELLSWPAITELEKSYRAPDGYTVTHGNGRTYFGIVKLVLEES